jgi:DNA-binding beta-propeller fold protein YncE
LGWVEGMWCSLRAGRAGVVAVVGSAWRDRGVRAIVVFGVCGWLLLGVASAFGAVAHPFLPPPTSFDGGETPAGSFQPGGVAVDNSGGPSAGAVYVADIELERSVVDKFASAPGSGYLCQITGEGNLSFSGSECDTGSPGTPSGHFGGFAANAPVAVDPGTGNVFVVDSANHVVDEFDSSGKYLSQVTGVSLPRAVAVDGVSGVVYITEAEGEIKRFDPVTSVLSTFASLGSGPGGIAVDSSGGSSAGDVYVVDSGNNVVDKFDPAGTLVAQITAPGVGSFGALRGVAVDPVTGDVYVADQAGGVVDQFDGAGVPIGVISGLETTAGAMEPVGVAVSSSGLVYVGDSAHPVVDAFGAQVVVPDVVTGGASNVTPTSATVQGGVNPDGIQLTDCHFDYVDDANYNAAAADPYGAGQTAPCVPAAGSIPADASEHAVTADLTGLTSGTGYHFRLEASNANGANRAGDATFSTVALPVIDGVSVTDLSVDPATLTVSATLNAKIDPQGFAAKYRFEYGTSTAYGLTVPVPDGDLGSGLGDVAVFQHVAGLSTETTYHWRVVATNENGATTGVDHTFIYQSAGSALPDGRAYEMVTPPQKNAALLGAILFGLSPQVAADGSRVLASAVQCFAGAQSCSGVRINVGSSYAFTRGPGGWQAAALSPSAQSFEAVTPLRYSADAGTALFSAPRPGQEDHFYVRRADGSLVDLGPLTPPADGVQGPRLLGVEASSDASHVVWESGFNAAHRFPAWPFDETVAGESLYEYAGFGGAQPALVAVSEGQGSTDLIGRCGGHLDLVPGGMSEDGRTVFFRVNECAGGSGVNASRAVAVGELFARVGGGEAGARTVAISQPSGLSPAAADLGCTSPACVENITNSTRFRAPRLAGASVDGSKAFFLSTQQLTDEASQDANLSDNAATDAKSCNVTVGAGGCNLYEYDFANPAGHELLDVSAGDASGARVGGVLAISPDGSHVYFVARGVLTTAANGRGQSAQAGAHNLYLFERDAGHPAGRVVFITGLAASDSAEWRETGRPANVTPDGRFLVFMSRGRLTADDTSLSGASQVFRYDATADSLTRVSVGEAGFNDNGNRSSATPCAELCAEDARIAPGHAGSQPLGESRGDSSMSDDGSFVFFQSPVALTARALDDVQIATTAESGSPVYAQNVYEWHAGHVYLISDARDVSVDAGQSELCLPLTASVCLLGADRSGANVFFSTADRLVAQDTDTELDYYDARVCPAADPCITAPPPSAACSGAACQAPAPAPPALLLAASVSFNGPGNGSAGTPVLGKVKVRAHTVHGSFLLQVSVSGKGAIAVSGAGLRAMRRSVGRAGTYRFAVSLTKKARAALRHRHGRRMKFRVHVSFQPAGGVPSTSSLTLSVKG